LITKDSPLLSICPQLPKGNVQKHPPPKKKNLTGK
jgi:hypothetical protein